MAELSSFDIYFLVKELQVLVRARIDKIFHESNSWVFGLHLPGKGKSYLNVQLPGLLYMSDEKGEIESSRLSINMRRHISNARVSAVEQLGFERIMRVGLESKQQYSLYFEFIRPGNIVLCNPENKIVLAASYKGYGSRMIRPNTGYEYPKKELNPLELDLRTLKKAIGSSKRKSIVITLAVELGLGGKYAEELCSVSKVDKDKEEASESDIERLHKGIGLLKNKELRPTLYYADDNVIGVTPFEFKSIPGQMKNVNSFAHALSHLTTLEKKPGKREKYMEILRLQEAQINGLEKSIAENQRKGELIYENYGLVKERLACAKKSKIVVDL